VSVQLPLNIQLRDDETFASFFVGDNNTQAYRAIKEFSRGIGDSFLYLWGTNGVGKSHLLQAVCHQAFELNIPTVYISFQEISSLSVEILKNLEKIPLVCLDDLQIFAGNAVWEEHVFHLFNRIRNNQGPQGRLLIAADKSPNQIQIQLPDLKSRLAWGVTYQIHALSDQQKLDALKLRAQCRGLELNETVGHFLLNHCPRNMTELFQILEYLDNASLAEQRRLTIPFVKQALGL